MIEMSNLEELICRSCMKRGATCWYGYWDDGIEPCLAFTVVKELYDYRDWLVKAKEKFTDKFAKKYLRKRFNCVNETISALEKYLKTKKEKE